MRQNSAIELSALRLPWSGAHLPAAQVSKSPVTPRSKSGSRGKSHGAAGLETRETADLEVS